MRYAGMVKDKTVTPYVLVKDLSRNTMWVNFPLYEGWDSWGIEVIPLEEWLVSPDINKFPLP